MNPEKRTDRISFVRSTIAWPTFRRASGPVAPEMVFRAPGLEFVARQIAASQRSGILDLGPPSRANVEFLSQFPCVLHIGDIFRALAEEPDMLAAEHELDPEVEDERDLEGVAERLLAYEDGARFDAVFAWDLLDYFDEALSRAVMRRIGHYCRTGTLIYLIISNREQIPDQPGRFTIVDEQHLRFERVGMGTRNGMRHSPRALERMMPEFRLQHSFMLGYELQDYLFSHV